MGGQVRSEVGAGTQVLQHGGPGPNQPLTCCDKSPLPGFLKPGIFFSHFERAVSLKLYSGVHSVCQWNTSCRHVLRYLLTGVFYVDVSSGCQ